MIKLLDLIKESQEQPIEEGWKENVMALALTAASLVGGGKAAKGQDILQKQPVATTNVYKQTKDTLNLNFGTNFKSGKYTFDQKSTDDLTSKLAAIGNFIKNHPNSDFKINIVSSESKVPNYDMEPSSANYKAKLDTGELANRRATSMKFAIQTLINKLKEEGINTGKVTFEPSQTLVGGPDWKQGMSPSDSKFTDHQFVKFRIVSEDKGFDFSAFSKQESVFYDVNKHITAIVFDRTRETYDVTTQGNVDYSHGDKLVRFVNGNTGKFIGEDYLVDGLWWNQNSSTTNVIDPEFKAKIIKNGKRVN